MDKPAIAHPHIPHRSDIPVHSSQAAANKLDEHGAFVRAQSFEAALNSARDRAQQSAYPNADADARDAMSGLESDGPGAGMSDDRGEDVVAGTRADPTAQSTESQISATEESLTQSVSDTLAKDSTDGLARSAAMQSFSDSSYMAADAGVSGSSPGGQTQQIESITSTVVASHESQSLHGAVTAENVATLMSRLAHSSSASDGQWSFTVLDEHSGIASLQLQRTLEGTWRVNVALDAHQSIDAETRAKELKSALQRLGHAVDSVTLTQDDASGFQP